MMGDPPSSSLQKTLVRSFTNELQGRNVLETSTKLAQEHNDAADKARRRSELRHYYEDPECVSKDFDAVDVVRRELQRKCDDFTNSKKRSHKHSFWHRASSAEKLAARMTTIDTKDFDGVKSLVETLKGEWQSRHGRAYECFQNVCGTLNSHKEIFAILPTQNTYAQTLCGAFSLVVQASVNHKAVEEFLPSQVAKLSDAATRCNRYTKIIRTKEMQRLVANLYKSLFSFFLKAATWYLESTVGHVFRSVSSAMTADYEQAAKDIEGIVKDIHAERHVATAAMQHDMLSLVEEIRAKADQNPDMLDIGGKMHETLRSLSEVVPKILERLSPQQARQATPPPYTAQVTKTDDDVIQLVSRDEAARRLKGISRPECGSDGLLISQERHIFLTEPQAVSGLSQWTQKSIRGPALLWIATVEGFPGMHSIAETAALGAITMAVRAEAPFISFCCGTPLERDAGDDATPEQAGLLSLVYSLISQLLQFRPAEDEARITEGSMSRMDGTAASWECALSMLEELLVRTPPLRYCIIHDLNALEAGGARSWVRRFLGVLGARFGSAGSKISLLFTTSGQSLELSATVPKADSLLLNIPSGQALE